MLDIEIVVKHNGEEYPITKRLSLALIHQLIGLYLNQGEAGNPAANGNSTVVTDIERPLANNPGAGERIIDYARKVAPQLPQPFRMSQLLDLMEAAGWESDNPNKLNNMRSTVAAYKEEFLHLGDGKWTYAPAGTGQMPPDVTEQEKARRMAKAARFHTEGPSHRECVTIALSKAGHPLSAAEILSALKHDAEINYSSSSKHELRGIRQTLDRGKEVGAFVQLEADKWGLPNKS